MKFNILILLFIITTFLQAEIVIVTNKNSDINSLSKESIKYLYLAKVNTINDIRIKALLSRNKTLHERFINNIINKDIQQYSSYWARLVFTGRKPIPRRLSREQIKEKLAEKNTIIYIDKKDINKDWKIVYER
ncbi:hypothetical protein [Poseidonibacter ostreae]|jgi:ABC-type phosphate transport system substrate-binding protein|uniref:Uncharacterized protein n=1 Tax=Poseidonibacter ostreae TaxID=2654171 RepID=A0A6L4WR63_9BACT|nr:hypothetical protein [Poseidonibacter ostreae]KAB7885440.1 hypothetical protein GA417_08385 [Poseidonibacter ostreae]KAB7887843.1 hypothetical protein GBG19_10160 [Poseidonibacter ostreae]KAB7890541.1 hypothetical protein GBG18_08855 [Poseidonibacter ostreae]